MSLKLGFDSNTSREARSVDDSEQNNAKVHVLKEREAESLARVPPLHYPNCWRSGSAIRITARAMPITRTIRAQPEFPSPSRNRLCCMSFVVAPREYRCRFS